MAKADKLDLSAISFKELKRELVRRGYSLESHDIWPKEFELEISSPDNDAVIAFIEEQGWEEDSVEAKAFLSIGTQHKIEYEVFDDGSYFITAVDGMALWSEDKETIKKAADEMEAQAEDLAASMEEEDEEAEDEEEEEQDESQ